NALRLDLFRHVLDLDMSFHKERTPGELIERIDGDVTHLSNFFSQFVVQLMAGLLLILGILVLFWLEDWRVALSLTIYVVVVSWRCTGVAKWLSLPAKWSERPTRGFSAPSRSACRVSTRSRPTG